MLIGVDVGGTTTAGGLVTLDGQVLSVIQVPTHRRGPDTGVETLLEVVGHLLAEAHTRGLGLEDALRECGSKTRAAERLGLSRQSLQQMLRRRQP